MDERNNVRVWRGGVFHFLISEAAGVRLSGLGGQACDMNVGLRRSFLCWRRCLYVSSRIRFTGLERTLYISNVYIK